MPFVFPFCWMNDEMGKVQVKRGTMEISWFIFTMGTRFVRYDPWKGKWSISRLNDEDIRLGYHQLRFSVVYSYSHDRGIYLKGFV